VAHFFEGKKLNFMNTAISYLVVPRLFQLLTCGLVTGVGLLSFFE